MPQDNETKLYWLVKGCLSSSEITQIPCSPCKIHDRMYARDMRKYCHNLHTPGRDVFDDEAKALARAEELRVKKIASLKKQLKKLEGMKFSTVPAGAGRS